MTTGYWYSGTVSLTATGGCRLFCSSSSPSAVLSCYSYVIPRSRGVISTFSWGTKLFFIFQCHRTIEKLEKQHFICSNSTLFIVPFFFSFFFSSFFSLFSFLCFFFLFFFFLWGGGGDGPPAPLKWRPCPEVGNGLSWPKPQCTATCNTMVIILARYSAVPTRGVLPQDKEPSGQKRIDRNTAKFFHILASRQKANLDQSSWISKILNQYF